MPKPLHEELARAAGQQQTSLNRYVIEVLSAAVADDGTGKAPTAEQRTEGDSGHTTASPRLRTPLLRVALATNLLVVVLAGIVALVLLILALERI